MILLKHLDIVSKMQSNTGLARCMDAGENVMFVKNHHSRQHNLKTTATTNESHSQGK